MTEKKLTTPLYSAHKITQFTNLQFFLIYYGKEITGNFKNWQYLQITL